MSANILSAARRYLQWSALILVFALEFLYPQTLQAQAITPTYDITRQCFAVADERITNAGKDSQDTLVRLDRTDAQTFVIGLTGTQDVEAIAFGPDATLYAVDGNRLGTLDLHMGVFTPKPQLIGTAYGGAGAVAINNVDGLFYDLHTDRLYGVQYRRQPQKDLLLMLDKITGAYLPGAFGPNADYVEITPVLDDKGNVLDDVNDLAVDPVTGVMYATFQQSTLRNSVLAIIDPATGAATKVAPMHYPVPYPADPARAGQNVRDVEGLSFFNDGQLYGSTGNNGPSAPDKNKLVRIDKTTGLTTVMGTFPAGLQDYEAIACLTADVHISLKKFTNGPGQTPQDADAPTGPSIPVGAPVTWTYYITNTGVLTLTNLLLVDDKIGTVGPGGASNCPPPNTILSPGKSILCTATGIAQSGQYSNTATITGSTPVGLVQPPKSATATDISHYFGVAPGLGMVKLTNGNPATNPNDPDVPVITPGATVTWTYRVTNNGNAPFAESEVKVTDNLIGPITQIVDKGNGDAILTPGETWLFQAVGTAVNLFEAHTTVAIVPGCDANQTGQTRPTYENIGTVTVRDLSASAPSHYCNPLAAIGDLVFKDINPNGANSQDVKAGNGLQDAGESGVDGVQVQLHTASGALIATLTTANGGLYRFANIAPGAYYLVFINPAQEGVWTKANQGADDALDSDADPTLAAGVPGNAARTAVFTLTPGQVDLRWDAGLVELTGAATGSLGDYVWHDRNGNGLQDEGPEQGIANAPVKLFSSSDQLVATTTTNAQGYYQFLDVAPGQYYLAFGLPAGFDSFSPGKQGGDKEKDSDVITVTGQSGRTPVFTFAGNGVNDFSWDAGLYQSAGVGDFVWYDTNHDGIQQPNEQATHGVADIKVELYQVADGQATTEAHANRALVQTTRTNDKGLYQFTQLAPGKYYLHFVLTESPNAAKLSLVGANLGADRSLDSDPAVKTGETAIFTLQSGQYDATWDAGVVVPEAEPEAPEPVQTKVFLPVVVR
ncbi:MAG: SdrD B-like domain-containing protein [Caldilineaceae bacterium]